MLMENKTTLLPSLYCKVFGHNYEVSKKVTYHIKEYKCKCCGKELTTNIHGELIDLTPKFREINAVLERIHTNKLNRMRRNVKLT